MIISMDKKYKTRDGRDVKLYAVDNDNQADYIVVGSVEGVARCWNLGGTFYKGNISASDLIEVKPRIKRNVWVNVYPKGHTYTVYDSKNEADSHASKERLACIEIETDCKAGEGL